MTLDENIEALQGRRTRIPNNPELAGCGSEATCFVRYVVAGGCVLAAIAGQDPAGFLGVAMLAVISLQISRHWPRPWPAPRPADHPPESSP